MRFEASRGTGAGERRIPYREEGERRIAFREEAEHPIPYREEGYVAPAAPSAMAMVVAPIRRSPLVALSVAIVVGFVIGFVLRRRVGQ